MYALIGLANFCWPPSKSHMNNYILFQKESDFLYGFFCVGHWLAAGSQLLKCF